MNGYKLMADSYRLLVEQGKIQEDDVKRDIEIYEFLSTCSTDDICRLVDSSAFNDIIKGYIELAVDYAEIDEKAQKKVLRQINWMFDEYNAKQVLEKYLN